jgi:hypothetical protein
MYASIKVLIVRACFYKSCSFHMYASVQARHTTERKNERNESKKERERETDTEIKKGDLEGKRIDKRTNMKCLVMSVRI